jgi:hypothetical protein
MDHEEKFLKIKTEAIGGKLWLRNSGGRRKVGSFVVESTMKQR